MNSLIVKLYMHFALLFINFNDNQDASNLTIYFLLQLVATQLIIENMFLLIKLSKINNLCTQLIYAVIF